MTVCASTKKKTKKFCCDLLKLFFEYHQAEEKLFPVLLFYVKLFYTLLVLLSLLLSVLNTGYHNKSKVDKSRNIKFLKIDNFWNISILLVACYMDVYWNLIKICACSYLGL